MTKVFDIAPVFDDLGFECSKANLFVAPWSTDHVEHLVFVSYFGRPSSLLTLHFGFRNLRSERFAFNFYKSVNRQALLGISFNAKTSCFMQFEIGRLFGGAVRWSVDVANSHPIEISNKISGVLSEELPGAVRGVSNLSKLCERLISDAEPCPWVVTNGALRAANIVYLSKQLELTDEEIKDNINPFSKYIELANVGSSEKFVDLALSNYS